MIDNPQEITRAFDRVVSDMAMRKAAKGFAKRYRDFDAVKALDKVVSRIEALAATASD